MQNTPWNETAFFADYVLPMHNGHTQALWISLSRR